ncbi:MAG: hypothetical protein CFH05_01154 [Alphaproteobacteria bacterium MarineAlpha3_Bin4]|nr:MAG: hypothetical protein CFH05_01154 [Alphaproteobacteria bacterium MarineAlpha3_Bin4]
MAKKSLGNKCSCPNCGALFYDLSRKKIVCPKCGADYVVPKPIKAKHTPAPVAEKSVPTPAEQIVAANDDEDAKLVGDDINVEDVDNVEEADELIEDASDLGVDDDDMSEVKEHIDSDAEEKG